MATLGLKEMGKFLWEGRKKGLPCWLSQFSGKCKKKSGIMKSGVDAMPLFLLDHLLKDNRSFLSNFWVPRLLTSNQLIKLSSHHIENAK